jgi:hypothetical protein
VSASRCAGSRTGIGTTPNSLRRSWLWNRVARR